MTRRFGRRWPWAAGCVLVVVLAQGCFLCQGFFPGHGFLLGQGVAVLAAKAAPVKSADQHFIVMMVPHHDGAIAMAELARTRAKRPEITALAQQIKASQTAENAQMRRWYRQWFGTDVPAWTAGGMGMGMGHGMGHGMGMPAMATSLQGLRTAPDFDRAFIEQMVPHHRMGVMMASHAQWNTQHPELRQLQAAMVRVQSREIAQMAQWYRAWYGASGS